MDDGLPEFNDLTLNPPRRRRRRRTNYI